MTKKAACRIFLYPLPIPGMVMWLQGAEFSGTLASRAQTHFPYIAA